MSTPRTPRLARIGEMVLAVARQLLADRGTSRLALLDDGSPEAALAAGLLAPLGDSALVRVAPSEAQVESVLHSVGAMSLPAAEAALEVRRLLVRMVPDAVPTLAANKTSLLLGGALPPEPFLPLGDLYASEVESLCGGWSAPAPVRRLAEAVGGIERLDDALRRRFEARDARALERLPDVAREPVERALAGGSGSRLYPCVVPKIGSRTIGVDLFE